MSESRRLTNGQAAVLSFLGKWDVPRDGALSGPDISRSLRKRLDDWAYGKLVALERRGFVHRLGSTFSGGICWNISAEGRAYLAAQKTDGD